MKREINRSNSLLGNIVTLPSIALTNIIEKRFTSLKLNLRLDKHCVNNWQKTLGELGISENVFLYVLRDNIMTKCPEIKFVFTCNLWNIAVVIKNANKMLIVIYDLIIS